MAPTPTVSQFMSQDFTTASASTSLPVHPAEAVAGSANRPKGHFREILDARQEAGVDDPAVLRQCQIGPADAAGRLSLGLGLSGLYCAACSLTIEDALRRVPGVSEVDVLSATQRARVVVLPGQVRMSALIRAIQDVGYKAWPDIGVQAINLRLAEQRRLLWRLMVAWFCMMQVMMISTGQYVADRAEVPDDLWKLMNWGSWVMSLPVMFFSCSPFFEGAWRGLRQGRVAMDLPVAIGILVMFLVSTGVSFGQAPWLGHDVYFDSLTMFVAFLLTGRWLESRAREKVTRSLESLSARLPDSVERQSGDRHLALGGAPLESVPLSALRVGDRVRVAAGQAFPADGQVLQGRTEVDESLLTGESRPVVRSAGQMVVAGSLNLSAPVWMSIERLGLDTRYQQIVDLVQQALTEKPGLTRAADRFAGPFLVAVIVLAALGALAWWFIDPSRALWVAVSVLVVTCPCALSLSAPSALLSAAGAMARQGVLVRHLDAIEAVAGSAVVVFDKTGTLTHPDMRVLRVTHWRDPQALPAPAPEALALAASLAVHSQHPVSRALVQSLTEPMDAAMVARWTDLHETAGSGLQAIDAEGRRWRLGSRDWVLPEEPAARPGEVAARVWMSCQTPGTPEMPALWAIELDESLRNDAVQAVTDLHACGLDVAVLSGDHAERVRDATEQLGGPPRIRVLAAGVSPERKLAEIRQIQAAGQRVCVVGDGINDAPVLACADASFVMDQGAALAQAQADFLVLGGRLRGLAATVLLSRRTLRVIRQNMLWAAAYNFLSIPAALMGWMPPWVAGIGMAASSLFVVLNSLRLGRATPARQPAPR